MQASGKSCSETEAEGDTRREKESARVRHRVSMHINLATDAATAAGGKTTMKFSFSYCTHWLFSMARSFERAKMSVLHKHSHQHHSAPISMRTTIAIQKRCKNGSWNWFKCVRTFSSNNPNTKVKFGMFSNGLWGSVCMCGPGLKPIRRYTQLHFYANKQPCRHFKWTIYHIISNIVWQSNLFTSA